MQRKVLFVITKSNWGGAQRYVFDLATSLPKEAFEVKVVYGGTGEINASEGVLAQKLKTAGIQGIFLPNFVRNVSLLREWHTLQDLIQLFKKESPAVVHLNSSKAGAIGALAARVAGVKKIIFTVHGWPFLEDRSLLAKTLIWLASWLTALLSTNIICISEYDLRIAKRMPFIKHKAVRIYNGIAPMEFASGNKIREAFPAGVTITGTIGELNKNKNQQTLIEEAFHNPHMYVAIVGGGELQQTLQNTIQEYGLEARVKLFGFIPATEALRGFDIFALPSKKEGLPYVLLEARQAGLPIVANRVGGIGEILDAKDMSDFTLDRMVAETVKLY